MVMNAMRSGAASGIIKTAIFGLIALGVGGMVFSDVGGFFRGGSLSRNDVAKVGGETISIAQFDRMARRALQRLGMTPEQAHGMGYMREMLNGEVRSRLLAHEASDLGLTVSRDMVADKIRTLIAPMMKPGQKPHEVLAQILQAQDMSETELVSSLRNEMSVGLLGKAVQSGFASVSAPMAADLATFEKESRDVEYIVFPDSAYKPEKAPSEAELRQMYESTKDAYATPELREGQIIILNTKDLKSGIDLTDEDLRDAYESNIDAYSQPETRTLEVTLLSDAKKASEVAAAVKSGKSLEAATKEVTGNTTDFIPARKYQEKELDDALRAEAFHAEAGEIIGPIETPLGHQVLVVKTVNPAQVQPFESVKEDLRKELLETKAADAKYDLANALDDALASGATPEDIKGQFDVEIKDIPAVNALGQGRDEKPALAAFGDHAAKILETLNGLNEGESSSVFDYDEGRMAAVALKSIVPKSYKPFEDIKPVIEKQWLESTRTSENKLQVLKIIAEMNAEKLDIKDIAAKYTRQTQSAAGLVRTKEPKAPITPGAQGSIFEAGEGEIIALDIEGGAAIAKITRVDATKTYSDDEMAKALPNMARSFQNESYEMLLEQSRKKYGASINDNLLDQTYAAKKEE